MATGKLGSAGSGGAGMTASIGTSGRVGEAGSGGDGSSTVGGTDGKVGSAGSGGGGISAATGKLGSAGSRGGGSTTAAGGSGEIGVPLAVGILAGVEPEVRARLWLHAGAWIDLTRVDGRTLAGILCNRLSPTPRLHIVGHGLGAAFGGGGLGITAGCTILSAQDAVIQLKARAANTPNLRMPSQSPLICSSG